MLRVTIKELGLHSIIYLIGGVASSLASILLLPIYTRFLTTADYGIIEIIDSIRYLLIILMTAGFVPALAKFFKEAESLQQKKEAAGTTFWFVLCISIIWSGIFYFFNAPAAEKLFGNVHFVIFVNLGIILLLIQAILTTGENYLNIRKKSRIFLVASLIKLLINVAANLYFIIGLGLGAKGLLYGEIVSMVAVGSFVIGYLIKESRMAFRFQLLIQMLKFGLPFVPNIVSAALMHRADRYLLQKFCTLEDVGIYGLGYKFPFMLNFLILQSFARIWNASVMYDVAKHEDAPTHYAKITTYFITLYAICQYMIVCMAPLIIKTLAAPDYFNSWKTLQIVGLGMSLYSFHNFFTIGAFIKNKTWFMPIAFMTSAGVNILLNWIFLPRFGYLAAAWNTVITYFVFSFLGYIVFRNIYPIPFEFKRLGWLFGLGISLVLVNNALSFDQLILNGAKQIIFASLLPLLLLVGPYFHKEEKESLYEEILKINPLIANWFRNIFIR